MRSSSLKRTVLTVPRFWLFLKLGLLSPTMHVLSCWNAPQMALSVGLSSESRGVLPFFYEMTLVSSQYIHIEDSLHILALYISNSRSYRSVATKNMTWHFQFISDKDLFLNHLGHASQRKLKLFKSSLFIIFIKISQF
jgi:hypothetical protein